MKIYLYITMACVMIMLANCTKEPLIITVQKPLEYSSYLLYDSVEGVSTANHYGLNRIINLTYNPNLDIYILDNNSLQRNTFFENIYDGHFGYQGTNVHFQYVLFYDDSISFHYRGPGGVSNTGFRITYGVKQ